MIWTGGREGDGENLEALWWTTTLCSSSFCVCCVPCVFSCCGVANHCVFKIKASITTLSVSSSPTEGVCLWLVPLWHPHWTSSVTVEPVVQPQQKKIKLHSPWWWTLRDWEQLSGVSVTPSLEDLQIVSTFTHLLCWPGNSRKVYLQISSLFVPVNSRSSPD